MGNVLVDTAIQGLRLAGLPVPPVTFIEMLINEGEDVLSAIPRLVTTIEAMGGAWSVLEEVAYGMEQYSPIGYVQRLVDQHFAPAIQVVEDIHTSKTTLIETHRTLLTHVTNQLTALAPAHASGDGQTMVFTGAAANTMNVRFADVSAQMNRLLDVMDQSRQIDQDLLMQLQFVKKVGMGMVVLDLVLLAIGLVLAPETVGGSLAIAGIVDAGLLGAEASILLGAILACFLVWGLRHALLAISTSLAPTHTQPTSPGPSQSGVTINQARSHQNDLPTGGDRPYIPKTGGDPSQSWDKAQKGFKDADGNVWVWPPAGQLHGGPHWDVEHPNKTHTNVTPQGKVIGKDNFPNKAKKK
jgi:hypothetical protein